MNAALLAYLWLYEEEKASARPARIYRNRVNAFGLDNIEFKRLFRLPKQSVKALCQELKSELGTISGAHTALSVENKVLCALSFYGHGSLQRCVGQNLTLGMSQSSVSRCVRAVSLAINKLLLNRFVGFPEVTQYEQVKQSFLEHTCMPDIIGVIGCTHVAITPPENEEVFINNKDYHSMNVQLVCDAKLEILNVNARFPGSVENDYIYKSSLLREELNKDNSDTDQPLAGRLVGDHEYLVDRWMLTPVIDPVTEPERRYNIAHSSASSKIARCKSNLKKRFGCLSKTLHYKPLMASHIINSCVVLYNICSMNNIDLSDTDSEEEIDDNDLHLPPELYDLTDYLAERSRYIEANFR